MRLVYSVNYPVPGADPETLGKVFVNGQEVPVRTSGEEAYVVETVVARPRCPAGQQSGEVYIAVQSQDVLRTYYDEDFYSDVTGVFNTFRVSWRYGCRKDGGCTFETPFSYTVEFQERIREHSTLPLAPTP